MDSYFKLADCGENIRETCYPLPGTLNTARWDYVFILTPEQNYNSFSYTSVALPSNPPAYDNDYNFTSFIGSSLLGKYQSSDSSSLNAIVTVLLPIITLLISLLVIV